MSWLPKKMKNSVKQWESQQLNRDTYHMYYTQLKNMALTLFEWEGLPPTVSEKFLEQILFEQGHILFVNDDMYGFIVVPCALGGEINFYNEATEYHAVAGGGYSKDFTPDNAVLINNNNLKEPTDLIVSMYATRLYEVERSIDVNIRAQKTPILILCEEQQRLSLKNLYMQYDGNEPFIFGNKSLDYKNFQVLKTDAPFLADKLINYKHSLWNECMTKLGLQNSNTDKKERLLEAEATSNEEQIDQSRAVMLTARQTAAAAINKMFGLNISVKFRVEKEEPEAAPEDDDEGGEE